MKAAIFEGIENIQVREIDKPRCDDDMQRNAMPTTVLIKACGRRLMRSYSRRCI
jgi:hypothetical protein